MSLSLYNSCHIVQKKGDTEVKNLFLYKNEEGVVYSFHKRNLSKWPSNKNVADSLRDVFLPRGYPYTVSSDYLEYQIWDSLQAFCSNLSGALSLHSTLEALGIGKSEASTLAATLTWLIKDGVGMASSIIFAYWKGCEFDGNNKQWRMFADLSLDVTNLIKLLAPLLPIPILVTLCFSSVMLSLVGVAGAATRISLISHQAKCNNAADVSAKDGSQETMINLCGLIMSLTFLPLLNSNIVLTWFTFFMLVLIHIYANYKAMRALQFNTLNRPRLLHIFKMWTSFYMIPDITSTNETEPLFFGPAFQSCYLYGGIEANLGCSFDHVVNRCPKFLEKLPFLFEDQRRTKTDTLNNFIIYFDVERQKIYVFFSDNAETEDYIVSFWACYLLSINYCNMVNKDKEKDEFDPQFKMPHNKISMEKYVKDVIELAQNTFKDLLVNLIDKGWTLDPLRLNLDEWKYNERFYQSCDDLAI